MIQGIIVHLANDLPILVDMEELPSGADRTIHCTNVRTLDGKRPAFAHDKRSTFIFPLHMVRLIEVPQVSDSSAMATQEEHSYEARGHDPEPEPVLDEIDQEAEEDLLARIRSI